MKNLKILPWNSSANAIKSSKEKVISLKQSKILLKCKQPAYDKGTLDSADTLLYKALIQGHTVNSDILG